MSTTLRITVTKEILEQSKMCNGPGEAKTNCAIALAVRDVFPNAFVFEDRIIPFPPPDVCIIRAYYRSTRIDLPEIASTFIKRFDNCKPCERAALPEFSFDVCIPDWVIDNIDISEVTKQLQNHPNLTLQTA